MHMLKAILLISILLFSISFAKYTSAEMEVNMEWNVVADGQISYANLSVSVPSNSSNQKVTSIQISEPYTLDTKGSVWKANINLENFTQQTIKGKFIVSTDYIKRATTPDTNYSNYLNSSELVDINEEITSAASFASSLSFLNSTIALEKWVHENIEYDKTYISGSYTASLTLQSRKGVCDEFSHLFIAMARSIRIPARIVVGYVFDTSGQIYENETWTPHAWAEVYDPNQGWIEVDPTYGEFMNLDALRVRTGTGVDQENTRDSIQALGFAKNLDILTNVKIKALKKSDRSNVDVNLQLDPEPKDSMHQPVTIILKNSNPVPIYLTASLALPQGFECNCSDSIILQPGERKEISYDVNLSGVAPDMQYNFSVKALTDYGSADGSFERTYMTPVYTTVKELPPQFMIFIGIAVAAAIVLIIAALMIKI